MSDTAKRVVVLKGGWVAEREVSLSSGGEAASALRKAGYDVEEIDMDRDVATALRAAFGGKGADVIFNALHGPFGEDGRVQSVFEFLNIPYTHSGPLASALAMHKPKAKTVLAAAGLQVPGGQVIATASLTGDHPLPPPYVLKPLGDGSSFGVFTILSEDQAAPTADRLDPEIFGGFAMVEPFIRGRELTVACLGDRPLTVTEIVPKGEFYDFHSKYAVGGSSHQVPAAIPDEIAAAAMTQAADAAHALGCRGLSRTDFRWDDERGLNGLFILEVNTQPGLTPTSLAPEQAAHQGMSFEQLVAWMVEDASCPR